MAEGVGPDAWVTVQMSRELVEQLRDWSEPVQVRVIETPGAGTGYTLATRKVYVHAELRPMSGDDDD